MELPKKYVGVLYKLDDDEEVIIRDDMPARIEVLRKKLIGTESLLEDLAGASDLSETYTIPYLTNKRIILWLLAVSKSLGPIPRWWELPLEFISNVKFGKGSIEITYKIPELEKGRLRQALGLRRGVENFKVVLYTRSMAIWKTHLSKILFERKKERLIAELEELKQKREDFRRKIDKLEDNLLEGKISEETYKRLKLKFEAELASIESKIRSMERELREIAM